MSHEATIHATQTGILRELLFKPQARFSELQKMTGLESDHFKFHLNRLVETDYVQKDEAGMYSLTAKGKEYANKLDTDKGVIERQPKSAVIIVLEHEGKMLVQERLKHPYFGFWGYPGGKIRWGETILEAAARELKEETDLTATFVHRGVYHEHVISAETGEILEDKLFQIVGASLPIGVLKESFEGGRNEWMSLDDLKTTEKKYASCDIETDIGLGKKKFVETTQVYKKDEF